MSDLNWILTKDHVPTIDECLGKTVIFHRPEKVEKHSEMVVIDGVVKYLDLFNKPSADRYILIDIPEYVPVIEPLPCRVCGKKPAVTDFDTVCKIICDEENSDHTLVFFGDTRAEAIALWNKHNEVTK